MAASNTTRRTAGRPTPTSPAPSSDAPTSCWQAGLAGVDRIPLARALQSARVHRHDYIGPYVADLANVVDMDAIRSSGVTIGIDPLGGAGVGYWQPIIDRYGIAATVVSDVVDPTFRFMTADWDGRIRMDCSSPYAMARLIGMRDQFDVAFANDTDADRHGIVAGPGGLMNPNHYLAAAIDYLYRQPPRLGPAPAIGKTVVSSAMIDRVARPARPRAGRGAGRVQVVHRRPARRARSASPARRAPAPRFLRRDGSVWTTDKDGLILGLLAAEITARTGHNPAAAYDRITDALGHSLVRADRRAGDRRRRRARLKALTPEQVGMTELAGEPVRAKLTAAPGNGAPIGGLKVIADNGWFAARPVRARRTSTRSMPRASRARRISARSSAKRRTRSAMCSQTRRRLTRHPLRRRPPGPVADLGQVLAVLVDVVLVLDQLVAHHLLQVGALGCRGPAGGRPRPAPGGSGRARSAPACRRPS